MPSVAHLVGPDAVDGDDEAHSAGIFLEGRVVEADRRRVVPGFSAAHLKSRRRGSLPAGTRNTR